MFYVPPIELLLWIDDVVLLGLDVCASLILDFTRFFVISKFRVRGGVKIWLLEFCIYDILVVYVFLIAIY